MKKLICLYSVAFHNSLLGQRFVFDVPAGPEDRDTPPPQGETPEGPSFEDRLGDVRGAKDAIERATALEEAMRTLDQEYAGKGTDRIRDGADKVAALADAMGLNKKDKAALMADYKENFQDWEVSFSGPQFRNGYRATATRTVDLVQRELDQAQEADTKSALDDLKAEAHAKEEEKFNTDMAALEQEKGTLTTAITADEAIVKDYAGNKLKTAGTNVDTALQDFEDLATNFGLGALEDYASDNAAFDRVSKMSDDDLKKACLAAEKEGDPRFEVHEAENLQATLQKDVDAVRAGQKEVVRVMDAKTALEAEKRVVQDRILANQDASAALDAKMLERSQTYETTKGAIEAGTYKDGDKTLKEEARAVAEGRLQPEEEVIITKYEQLAQSKTKELLRGAAVKQLNAMREKYDGLVARKESAISTRTSELWEKRTAAEKALATARSECGLYASNETVEERRAAVEAKITKENPRLAARDPAILAKYVENDLADIAKKERAQTAALLAYHGEDPKLRTLNQEKRELEAVVARIDAVKASPVFQA